MLSRNDIIEVPLSEMELKALKYYRRKIAEGVEYHGQLANSIQELILRDWYCNRFKVREIA